jgi:hypothetical protein
MKITNILGFHGSNLRNVAYPIIFCVTRDWEVKMDYKDIFQLQTCIAQ